MPMLSADLLERHVLEAVLDDLTNDAMPVFLAAIERAIDARRGELHIALAMLEGERKRLEVERDAAMNAITDPALSPLLKTAFVERAEAAVQAYAALEAKQRVVQTGLAVLDTQAHTVTATLNNPDLDPGRWQEPRVYEALRRALHLLVHEAWLVEEAPRTYTVELKLYTPESLLIREFTTSESAWESNPPAKLVTPPNRFEDGGQHRPTPTLACYPNRTRMDASNS